MILYKINLSFAKIELRPRLQNEVVKDVRYLTKTRNVVPNKLNSEMQDISQFPWYPSEYVKVRRYKVCAPLR